MNISPFAPVVVAVGAVSPVNSNTAFQAIVFVPPASCMHRIEIYCPVVGLEGASKVTFAVSVTLATGDARTSQSCVASNDSVSSVKTTAPDIAVKLLESDVNTFDAAVVPAVIPSNNSSSASARTALPAVMLYL